MKIAYPVLARPGGAQANTHAPDVCQAVDCANSQRFPSTGDLCLTCWTRERKGKRLPRKGSGRGGRGKLRIGMGTRKPADPQIVPLDGAKTDDLPQGGPNVPMDHMARFTGQQ